MSSIALRSSDELALRLDSPAPPPHSGSAEVTASASRIAVAGSHLDLFLDASFDRLDAMEREAMLVGMLSVAYGLDPDDVGGWPPFLQGFIDGVKGVGEGAWETFTTIQGLLTSPEKRQELWELGEKLVELAKDFADMTPAERTEVLEALGNTVLEGLIGELDDIMKRPDYYAGKLLGEAAVGGLIAKLAKMTKVMKLLDETVAKLKTRRGGASSKPQTPDADAKPGTKKTPESEEPAAKKTKDDEGTAKKTKDDKDGVGKKKKLDDDDGKKKKADAEAKKSDLEVPSKRPRGELDVDGKVDDIDVDVPEREVPTRLKEVPFEDDGREWKTDPRNRHLQSIEADDKVIYRERIFIDRNGDGRANSPWDDNVIIEYEVDRPKFLGPQNERHNLAVFNRKKTWVRDRAKIERRLRDEPDGRVRPRGTPSLDQWPTFKTPRGFNNPVLHWDDGRTRHFVELRSDFTVLKYESDVPQLLDGDRVQLANDGQRRWNQARQRALGADAGGRNVDFPWEKTQQYYTNPQRSRAFHYQTTKGGTRRGANTDLGASKLGFDPLATPKSFSRAYRNMWNADHGEMRELLVAKHNDLAGNPRAQAKIERQLDHLDRWKRIKQDYPQGVPFNNEGLPDFSRYRAPGVRPAKIDINHPDRVAMIDRLKLAQKQALEAFEKGDDVAFSANQRAVDRLNDRVRAWDESAANKDVPKLEGYTYHHDNLSGQLIQVPTDLHDFVRHVGGFKVWQR